MRLGFVSGSGGIMKPWAWSKRGKLAALAALAVVLAAVGGIVAFALGPGGAANGVRLSGPSGSVPCGVSVSVSVYLDDLEARPSPNAPGVNYGLNAFAFWINYDPDILRIQSQSDVILNPELNQMDPDGDGVLPSFGLFGAYIDSYNGTLTYAAGSVVADPRTNLGEEGPDPVWAQRPIQLFQVQFLTNNAGTSPVTISRVELGDPGTQAYEPVTITNTSVTVSGGNCPNLPRPTPTPTPPATPTATPTPTPTTTPTPEGLGRGPEPVAPVLASKGGRPDCPADWYVYNDPDGHFSICYPADWAAEALSPDQPDWGRGLHIASPHGNGGKIGPAIGSALTVRWRAGSPFAVGCRAAPTDDGLEQPVEVGGRPVVACHFEMPPDAPVEVAPSTKTDRVEMTIPNVDGGYLEVLQMRTASTIDLSRIVLEEPLGTLRVGMAE